MDKTLVAQKLESLRRCIMRVKTRCPETIDALLADLDIQDILSLNLTRAIQLCVDIGAHWLAEHGEVTSPKTMGQIFDVLANGGIINADLAMRLRRSVGFRNIMVHNYGEVDWQIVFAICTQHLTDFREFAKAFSDLIEP